ncbi:MAG: hypothetical protein ABIP39_07020 [Polyangiaceae bacterium]
MHRGLEPGGAIAASLLALSLATACAKDPPPPAPAKEHGERLALGSASVELPVGARLKSDAIGDPDSVKASHLYELTNHSALLVQELANADKNCDAYLDALFAAESKSKNDDGLKPIRSVEILSRHVVNGAKAVYVEAGMRSPMELKIGRPYRAVVLLTICDPGAVVSISASARTPGPVTVEMRNTVEEMAASLTLKK